jgi:hypothetical protein
VVSSKEERKQLKRQVAHSLRSLSEYSTLSVSAFIFGFVHVLAWYLCTPAVLGNMARCVHAASVYEEVPRCMKTRCKNKSLFNLLFTWYLLHEQGFHMIPDDSR